MPSVKPRARLITATVAASTLTVVCLVAAWGLYNRSQPPATPSFGDSQITKVIVTAEGPDGPAAVTIAAYTDADTLAVEFGIVGREGVRYTVRLRYVFDAERQSSFGVHFDFSPAYGHGDWSIVRRDIRLSVPSFDYELTGTADGTLINVDLTGARMVRARAGIAYEVWPDFEGRIDGSAVRHETIVAGDRTRLFCLVDPCGFGEEPGAVYRYVDQQAVAAAQRASTAAGILFGIGGSGFAALVGAGLSRWSRPRRGDGQGGSGRSARSLRSSRGGRSRYRAA